MLELTIQTITPEIAKEWLANNTDNRTLRKLRVAQYAAAMQRGEWLLTGEPIMKNGTRLLNGQHRLAACVLADVPFTTAVATGVDITAMTVMDSGLPRSMGDVLRFNGLSNVNVTAATARLVLEWRVGAIRDPTKSSRLITREDIYSMVRSNEELFMEAARQGARVHRATGFGASVWAALWFEVSRVDSEVAGLFFDRLVDGAGLTDTSPILALRNWCVNSVANNRNRRKTEVLTAAAKAWNAFVVNRPLKLIKVYPNDEIPGLVGI